MTPRRPFTPRELEVLSLVVRGLSDQEIAAKLVVSRRTVHTHVRSMFDKARVRTRTQLAVFALRARVVPLESLEDEDGS